MQLIPLQKPGVSAAYDGWVELTSFGYRCHFWAFQIKLDILDTQNFGNGSVVEELQPFDVGAISKNPGKSRDFYKILKEKSKRVFKMV